ncbi:hypothetical protein GEZ92_02405 [Streptococcus mitis]|nr:hypothetical protein [Streptococcus mitis]MQQ13242.1 hypothetical protein [Streptococcus mitis]MQQ43818.1 hypothetical protein [Streptococcus mitis]MQQ59510.1 hypothetical protein [Streptococcus mitis]
MTMITVPARPQILFRLHVAFLNGIQAKKNAPNPLSIKVFQDFQAIIKRISEQTKKPQAIACGERTF